MGVEVGGSFSKGGRVALVFSVLSRLFIEEGGIYGVSESLAAQNVLPAVHVGESLEHVGSTGLLAEDGQHGLAVGHADLRAVSEFEDLFVLLALLLEVGEESVLEVLYEQEGQLEGPEVLVGLPPETEGVVHLQLALHFGHGTELAALDHRKDEENLLPGRLGRLVCLIEHLVILHTRGPELVLDGLVDVVVVGAADHEKRGVPDAGHIQRLVNALQMR